MGLKWCYRGPLEWHYIRTKFHKIYQSFQKLSVADTQADGQTDL
jgi:hypothetical protein